MRTSSRISPMSSAPCGPCASVTIDRARLDALSAELKRVNAKLWDVEDAIRECDARGDFGDDFIELARAVYRFNDERARLKKAINVESGSRLVEEKSYKSFQREDPGQSG